MHDRDVLDEFGKALVREVRDPTIVRFSRGAEAPASGEVSDRLVALAPLVVEAVLRGWTDAARTGRVPTQVWDSAEWVDPTGDERASGRFRELLTAAAEPHEVLVTFSEVTWPRPDTILVSQRWWDAMHTDDLGAALASVVPDIVDSTINSVLSAIDDDGLQMRFRASDQKRYDLSYSEGIGWGELLGWYLGPEDGWLQEFAAERVNPLSEPGPSLEEVLAR